MRLIKLSIPLFAACLACFSCAGFPFNKRLPEPPEGLKTVKLHAVFVPEETFSLISEGEMSYEDAADLWHRGDSLTIYFKEVPYEQEDDDPVPPSDAVVITPEGCEYPIYVSGLRIHHMEENGLVVLCGEGRVYHGKSVIDISPSVVSINDEVVDLPKLTVHSREVLDESEYRGYGEVENVTDVIVTSDGRWWEGVQHVSP